LESEAANPSIWDDPVRAQDVMRRLSRLKVQVQEWEGVQNQGTELRDLLGMAIEEGERGLVSELIEEVGALSASIASLEFQSTLSGENDNRPAILAIHAGAGGTDAQDWAEMLLRMYVRWSERRGYATDIIDLSPGDEAGVKRVVLNLKGDYAYGFLKAERGVHRLVRLSPFSSTPTRHTSFALVEVLPEAEDQIDIVIRPEDVNVETFHASGHGGQSVQKNATAVRITHFETGIVTTCQNERSQIQNKDMAFKILRARIFDLETRKRNEEKNRLKGGHVSPEFGNQIRSYVMHPYQMVKDHRTDYETAAVESVMDGEIDSFIDAFLISDAAKRSGQN
jgi:peptide chain release factor 2